MQLYGRRTAFNVQKVLWLLGELELDFESIQVGGEFGGLDKPEFAALNPMQKVPVLIDGEKVVWESHTVLRYLAAQYGGVKWYANDAYQRSLYERWMDWAHCTFQPAFMDLFWGYYRMPESKRDHTQIERALAGCKTCLEKINQPLGHHAFIAGHQISLADITLGAIIFRLVNQGLEIKLPANVQRWYAELKQRPAYQSAIMSDFSSLKAREDY